MSLASKRPCSAYDKSGQADALARAVGFDR